MSKFEGQVITLTSTY